MIRVAPEDEAGHVLATGLLTVNLRGISLRSALNIMLDRVQMDYRVTDEGVVVIIPAAAESISRRPLTKRQDEAARRNFRTLESKRVTLQFVDTPLMDVAAYLGDELGIQFVLDQDGLNAVRVEPESLVTVNIQDVLLHQALTALLTPYDLRIALRNEAIYFTARDDRMARREIPAEFYQLARQPVELDFQEVPLCPAIDSLIDQTRTTMIVDRRRVETAGVQLERKISISRRRVPLREALVLILEPHGLRAMVYNEVLFITPIVPGR